jgi:hypothetical protein
VAGKKTLAGYKAKMISNSVATKSRVFSLSSTIAAVTWRPSDFFLPKLVREFNHGNRDLLVSKHLKGVHGLHQLFHP